MIDLVRLAGLVLIAVALIVAVIVIACLTVSSRYSKVEEMDCEGKCYKCNKTEDCNLYVGDKI